MNKLVERLLLGVPCGKYHSAGEPRRKWCANDNLCENCKTKKEAAALIEALEKDAKRYKAIRAHAETPLNSPLLNKTAFSGAELDAIIDAALNAGAGK